MKSRLLIMLIPYIIILFNGCSESSNEPVSEEITIGALIPFTGSFGTQGEAILKALQFAVEDINEELSTKNKVVKLIYDDTRTDPATTEVLFSSYANQGMRVIIGPGTSLALKGIVDTVNGSNTIIISPSSTATELAIENDNIFRVIPDDSQSAEDIANRMWNDGIENLSQIYRIDPWGIALAEGISNNFQQIGGTSLNVIGYFSFRFSEYAECLETCIAQIDQQIQTVGPDKVAIQLTSFDEGVDIMSLVELNNYSSLRQIKWYGSEGITLNDYFLENEEVVALAREVGFISPMHQLELDGASEELVTRLENELGYEPNAYPIHAYDAFMVAARTLAEIGTDVPISTLRTAIHDNLDGYNGASGEITLNAAGDRTGGRYSYWGISETGDPVWELKN